MVQRKEGEEEGMGEVCLLFGEGKERRERERERDEKKRNKNTKYKPERPWRLWWLKAISAEAEKQSPEAMQNRSLTLLPKELKN
jgi:hypothetical protein